MTCNLSVLLMSFPQLDSDSTCVYIHTDPHKHTNDTQLSIHLLIIYCSSRLVSSPSPCPDFTDKHNRNNQNDKYNYIMWYKTTWIVLMLTQTGGLWGLWWFAATTMCNLIRGLKTNYSQCSVPWLLKQSSPFHTMLPSNSTSCTVTGCMCTHTKTWKWYMADTYPMATVCLILRLIIVLKVENECFWLCFIH